MATPPSLVLTSRSTTAGADVVTDNWSSVCTASRLALTPLPPALNLPWMRGEHDPRHERCEAKWHEGDADRYALDPADADAQHCEAQTHQS